MRAVLRWPGRALWWGWVLFTAWLVVFAMPLSAVAAGLGAWVTRPWGSPRWGWIALAWSAGLLSVPALGLPEFADTTNRLHCRALGFLGVAPSADCDLAEVERGRVVARDGGALFTARERLGVHGFNHLLALGGLVAGLPEVASETARMSWRGDPLDGGAAAAPAAARRRQCSASQGGAALADPVVVSGDFPMRSSAVRRVLAVGGAQLPERAGAEWALGQVHFTGSGGIGDIYLHALRHDSVRVALALEVGDSRLAIARREDGAIDATWFGTIHYPGADAAFAVTIPTLWGPRVLRVSETVFCGMHVDGAMNPFPLEHRWRLEPGDVRLSPEGRLESRRGWLEGLAHQLAAL